MSGEAFSWCRAVVEAEAWGHFAKIWILLHFCESIWLCGWPWTQESTGTLVAAHTCKDLKHWHQELWCEHEEVLLCTGTTFPCSICHRICRRTHWWAGTITSISCHPDIPNGINGNTMSPHLWKNWPTLLCQLSPNDGCLESFQMPDFVSKVTSVVFKPTSSLCGLERLLSKQGTLSFCQHA